MASPGAVPYTPPFILLLVIVKPWGAAVNTLTETGSQTGAPIVTVPTN